MVRKADEVDLDTLADLAVLMWEKYSVNELISELSAIILNAAKDTFTFRALTVFFVDLVCCSCFCFTGSSHMEFSFWPGARRFS